LLVFSTVLIFSIVLIFSNLDSSEARTYKKILENSNKQTNATITNVEKMSFVGYDALGNIEGEGISGLKISYSFTFEYQYFNNKEVFKYRDLNSDFIKKINKLKIYESCIVSFNSNNPEISTIYSK
jgi:hypothetical protein